MKTKESINESFKEAMMFSVVMCTFNNLECLQKSIITLQAEELITEIIVYNNASTDGTKKFLNKIASASKVTQSPYDFKVIHSNKNKGVIESRNYALRAATKKYTIIFDDDQYITVGHTMKLYREALKKFNIVGYIPGLVNLEVGAIVVEEDGGKFNHVGEGGLCMATKTWHQLDYFDEAFSPAYFEGVDLQLRAIKLDKKIACLRDARVFHDGSKTLSRSDIGFNIKEIGQRNFKMLMKRLNDNYYGTAYKKMGVYVY